MHCIGSILEGKMRNGFRGNEFVEFGIGGGGGGGVQQCTQCNIKNLGHFVPLPDTQIQTS